MHRIIIEVEDDITLQAGIEKEKLKELISSFNYSVKNIIYSTEEVVWNNKRGKIKWIQIKKQV